MTFLQRHAYGIGCGFASALWPFFRKRRRIAVENIMRCGITGDKAEALRIAKASWRHLAGHIAEALFVPGVVNRENWREHLDFEGTSQSAIKLLLDAPETPILLVSAHHGVWEAATNILSFARPMMAIARVQNNKLVANWMKKHHFRGPVTIIDKNKGFTTSVIHKWVEDKAAMTILMDQHAWRGALLKFLGHPARTHTSAARLAIRYGYPIVVGSFVRIAPYKYRLVGDDPLSFSKEDGVEAATQILNDRLSDCIRKYPDQYLWAHRRWRED